ncbi:MAG: hypothetical protein IJF50_11200 [Peptococcaceae bacterium]|nr:hypothetical protein [Peptococcaceae bacterium]
MNETLSSVLPWICLGITFALYGYNYWATKKSNGKRQGNFMFEGMCLGVVFGIALSGNGMVYGMLAGTLIGMMVKKNPDKETNRTN